MQLTWDESEEKEMEIYESLVRAAEIWSRALDLNLFVMGPEKNRSLVRDGILMSCMSFDGTITLDCNCSKRKVINNKFAMNIEVGVVVTVSEIRCC